LAIPIKCLVVHSVQRCAAIAVFGAEDALKELLYFLGHIAQHVHARVPFRNHSIWHGPVPLNLDGVDEAQRLRAHQMKQDRGFTAFHVELHKQLAASTLSIVLLQEAGVRGVHDARQIDRWHVVPRPGGVVVRICTRLEAAGQFQVPCAQVA